MNAHAPTEVPAPATTTNSATGVETHRGTPATVSTTTPSLPRPTGELGVDDLIPKRSGTVRKEFEENADLTPVSLTQKQDGELFNYLDTYIKTLEQLRDAGKLKQADLDLLEGYKLVHKRLADRKTAIERLDKAGTLGTKKTDVRLFHTGNETILGLAAMEEIRRHQAAAMAVKIMAFPDYNLGAFAAPGRVQVDIPDGRVHRGIWGSLSSIFSEVGAAISFNRNVMTVDFQDAGAANRILQDFVKDTGFAGGDSQQIQGDLRKIEAFRTEIYSQLTGKKDIRAPDFQALIQDFEETFEPIPVAAAPGPRDIAQGRNRLVLHNLIVNQLAELMKRPENIGQRLTVLPVNRRFQLRSEAARSAAMKLLKREKDVVERDLIAKRTIKHKGEGNVGINTLEQVATDLQNGKYREVGAKPTEVEVEATKEAKLKAEAEHTRMGERVKKMLESAGDGQKGLIEENKKADQSLAALTGRRGAADYNGIIDRINNTEIPALDNLANPGSFASVIKNKQDEINRINAEIAQITTQGSIGAGPGLTPIAEADRPRAVEFRREQIAELNKEIAEVAKQRSDELARLKAERGEVRGKRDDLEKEYQEAKAKKDSLKAEMDDLIKLVLGVAPPADADVPKLLQEKLAEFEKTKTQKIKEFDEKEGLFKGTAKRTLEQEAQDKLAALGVRAGKAMIEGQHENKFKAAVAYDERELQACANVDTGTEHIRDLFFRWLKGDPTFVELFRDPKNVRVMLSDVEILLHAAEYYGRTDIDGVRQISSALADYQTAEKNLRELIGRRTKYATDVAFNLAKTPLEAQITAKKRLYSAMVNTYLGSSLKQILPELDPKRHDSLEAALCMDKIFEGFLDKCLQGKPFEEIVFTHQEKPITIS